VTVHQGVFEDVACGCSVGFYCSVVSSNTCLACPATVAGCSFAQTGSLESTFDCYEQCFDNALLGSMDKPWCIKCTVDDDVSTGYVEKIIGKINIDFILQQK
jgi:hypothetical protein